MLKSVFVALPFSVVTFLAIIYANRNTNIFSLNRSDVDENDRLISNELKNIINQMGVVDASSSLRDSLYEPSECLKETQYNLCFKGVVGSKWVSKGHVRSEFQRAVERVDLNDGDIRFLLINPTGRGFKQLEKMRDGAISTEPLSTYQEMAQKYNALSVRLYNYPPSFRLVFINESRLVISRYKLERDKYIQTQYGWDKPHLEIERSSVWSLYDPFRTYYEQAWQSAISVSDIEI